MKSKKIFGLSGFLLFLVLYGCIPISSFQDCSAFKNGSFTHRSDLDGTVFFLTRIDSVQIEVNTRTGHEVKSKITWNKDCEYEVLFISQSQVGYDSSLEFMRNRPMKTKILNTGSDYYVFESRIDSFDFRYTDTLVVKKRL
jgi:hypothetical protein